MTEIPSKPLKRRMTSDIRKDVNKTVESTLGTQLMLVLPEMSGPLLKRGVIL